MNPFNLDAAGRAARGESPAALARQEAFWDRWARGYARDDRFSQLNYGFFHPSLTAVLEVEIETMREINRRGSHFKRWDSAALLEQTRSDVAVMVGADAGEIVLTRNASEALNLVIQGIPLSAGDEVICSDHDYTAVDQAWEQRARREGIRIRRARVPLDPADDDEVEAAFAALVTPRTRIMTITHVIHFTGQVLPVARLCAFARAHGIEVLVDAAHALAQIEFSALKLGCDYLAASLHKWLGAPLGTGLLFVRKDRIASLRPLYGEVVAAEDDVRRLEHFGNRPDSAWAGIREAIRWHRGIGTAAKRERLLHLQRSWTHPLRSNEFYQVLSPSQPERQSAIGAIRLEGVPAGALCRHLMEAHRIFATVLKLPDGDALRVTPGLATSSDEIAELLEALTRAPERLADQGKFDAARRLWA